MKLVADNISWATAGRAIVDGVSFSIETGKLTVLLGPNGSGKTSLLRLALGLEKRDTGTAFFDGQPIDTLSPLERARSIAYLPQRRQVAWPLCVHDVVALGRFAYGTTPGRLGPQDKKIVADILRQCCLQELQHRPLDSLSGGEEARVHCARALAAETPLLIADEPAAALDPLHQHHMMQLFQSYVAKGGGALIVLHDLPLAFRYADHVVLLKSGSVHAKGAPADVMTPANLEACYGIKASIHAGHLIVEGAAS